MKTVKQVAELTGISIRTLQYYDEIGVFKPTQITDSGYRLYDEEALNTLQQILFFKELDFQLKEIKEIMENPCYNKLEAFSKQKKLIKAKRDRLNRLLLLLERLEKGESDMSFKEFDLSEYLQVLSQFKTNNASDIIKNWGSIEKFDDFIQHIKDHEERIAKNAIKYYGSIEAYTKIIKENLEHFPQTMEKLNGNIEKNNDLHLALAADLSKDVASSDIQAIVQELILMSDELTANADMGEDYWDKVIQGFLHEKTIIAIHDQHYGSGSSEYFGRALQYYFNKQLG